MRRAEAAMDGKSGQGRSNNPPDSPEVHSAEEDQRHRGDSQRGECSSGQQVDSGLAHIRRCSEGGGRLDARLCLRQFPPFRRLFVLHTGLFIALFFIFYSVIHVLVTFF